MKKIIGIIMLSLAAILLFGGVTYGFYVDGYSVWEAIKMLATVFLVVAVFMLLVYSGINLLSKK